MKRLIAGSVLLFVSVLASAQNLNFKTAPMQDAASTVAWTSATALNTALKITVTNRSSVSVYYSPSGGSVTGGVISFQRSQDDSIYSPAFCVGTDATNNGTQFTLGATAQEWTCAIGGATKFQVKLTTQVAGAGTANVSLTGTAAPPSTAASVIASSALPTGAATETTVAAMNAKIPASPATDRTTAAAPGAVRLSDGASFYKPTTPADTQPVSAASLPLPTGAAQDSTLTGGTQRAKVTDGTNNAAVKAASTAAGATDPALVVAVSPNNTVGITASSLPLPTGAAQDSTLTGGTVRTKVTDGTNNAAVKAASTAAGATDPALVVAVSPNNTVAVSAASLPLPSGAAQDSTLTGGTVRTKVTDGTNNAAVKAASTAAGATDPALVVAVSPNNTVAVSLATVPSHEVNSMASATTTNAASECAIVSAASNNATNCKASAGNFYGVEIFNTTTTLYYLRLYNLATSPTCSSATGFIRSIPIPPAGAAGGAGGAVNNFTVPVGYSAGIGYCITAGSSSTDNTSAATGVFGAIRYK